MKKVITGVLIVVLLTSVFMLYSRNKKYFAVPDKIVLYKDGDMKTISKDNKLFIDIVNQINKRAKNKLSVAKLGFSKEDMDSLKHKEIILEFVYSKIQVSKLSRGDVYTHLIFPLTGELNELCFIEKDDGNNYSGPVGPLQSPNFVLDLIARE